MSTCVNSKLAILIALFCKRNRGSIYLQIDWIICASPDTAGYWFRHGAVDQSE